MTNPLPATGGSYVRSADGSLRPTAAAEPAPAALPTPKKPGVKPAVKEA